MHQHIVFEQHGYDSITNPLDTSYPPRFQVENIGQDIIGDVPVIVHLAGSWGSNDLRAGFAFEISTGASLSLTRAGFYGYAGSLAATTVFSCLKALKWALDNRCHQLQLLTDSQQLVHNLSSDKPEHVQVWWTIQQIRYLAKQLRLCKLMKVPRSNLCTIRKLATWCRIHRIGSTSCG